MVARTNATRRRLPAVAGSFYASEPGELRRRLRAVLQDARDAADGAVGPPPKAIVVPHAGHLYSGPIAASAFARLLPLRDRIERVVMIGPSHFSRFLGIAATEMDAFETPLGSVPVDRDLVAASLDLPHVHLLDGAHADEHSLEVQLPFLQIVLERFAVAPFLVGEATGHQVAELLAHTWGDDATLVLVSSDLSHYHDAATARRWDARTAESMERLDAAAIGPQDACGHVGVQGLLHRLRAMGLGLRAIDLRNSGDTAGTSDDVVGYGAFLCG